MSMCGGVSQGDVSQIEQYYKDALAEVCKQHGHYLKAIEAYTKQVVAGFKFGYSVLLEDGKAHVEIWHKPGNKAYECTRFAMD